MVYDDNAQPLSMNFGEYLLPLATDVPRVDLVHLETPSPLNPLGIKGAGEGGTIPAIARSSSASKNALAPFGVTIAEVPISPQRIVELLGETRARRTVERNQGIRRHVLAARTKTRSDILHLEIRSSGVQRCAASAAYPESATARIPTNPFV
jgi:hypothetical protein